MYLYVPYPSFISPYVIPGLPIRWYSLMYVVAFTVAYLIFQLQRKRKMIEIDEDDTLNLFIWAIGFLLLGARLGSVLIYDDNRLFYILRPWMIFWPFRNGTFIGLPGMSYHGGVVGIVVGIALFCRSTRKRAAKQYDLDVKKYGAKRAAKLVHSKSYGFFQISDALLLGIPLGFTFGRLGNFINAELYGRVTTSPLGMLFPNAEPLDTSISWVADMATQLGFQFNVGDWVNLPRYPSQLYEAFFEGIAVFLILWFVVRPFVRNKKSPHGIITGWYLILYGMFRFLIEYIREPDVNLGYVISIGGQEGPIQLFESIWNFSMGQVLCALMIIAGIAIIMWRTKKLNDGE